MKKIIIQGKNITLFLLGSENLLAWKTNKEIAEKNLGLVIDSEEIIDNVLNAFNKKIENMKTRVQQ
jgi:hypothetical protein